MCGVENGLRNIRDESKTFTVRSKVTEILKKAQPPKKNISKQEIVALKELKENSSLFILKADKGNSTVILDRDDYDLKIRHLLEDQSTYQKLPSRSDPTKSITKILNEFVWESFKK